MTVALGHLLLASLGVALGSFAATRIARRWRSRPIGAYRLVLALALAALGLPLVQLAAQGRGLSGWSAPILTESEAVGPAIVLPELTARLDGLAANEALETDDVPRSLAPEAAHEGLYGERVDSPRPVAGTTAPARAGTPAAARRAQELRTVSAVLLALYAAGVLAALLATLARWRRTRALVARATPAGPEAVARWNAASAGSRVGRRARVLCSHELRGPACFGILRPTVVLPQDDPFALRPALARCVLLHELVHLERRDTWSLLVREALLAAFWFHPGARSLARTLDELRELSCDAHVVARTGDARSYASSLVEYASARYVSGPRETALLAASWPDSASSLHRRIDMLIALRTNVPSARRGTTALGLVLLAALGVVQVASAAAFLPATGARLAHDPIARAPLAEAAVQAVAEPEPAPSAPPRLHVAGPGTTRAPLFPERRPVETRPSAAPERPVARDEERVRLGLRLAPVSEALAAQLGRPAAGMMLIEGLIEGSPAEAVGLLRFDVIAEVDGQPATMGALEDAGRNLARGESVRLQAIRAGQLRVFVVGPIDDAFRKQWNDAVDRLRWSPLPDRTEASEAQARELLELARDYYGKVDSGRFRGDLERALSTLEGRKNEDQVTRATRDYARLLHELLERDEEETDDYLKDVRGTLGRMTPDVFWSEHGRRLTQLDPQTYRSVLERWQRVREGADTAPWKLDRSYLTTGPQAGKEAELELGRRELEEARAELRRQESRLKELSERLERLERRESGR